MRSPPILVFSLLFRGALTEIPVSPVSVNLPLVINHGLVRRWLALSRFALSRLAVVAVVIVVPPAAGG
jgi:hypothetical protein